MSFCAYEYLFVCVYVSTCIYVNCMIFTTAERSCLFPLKDKQRITKLLMWRDLKIAVRAEINIILRDNYYKIIPNNQGLLKDDIYSLQFSYKLWRN